jgi:hypothetical protein
MHGSTTKVTQLCSEGYVLTGFFAKEQIITTSSLGTEAAELVQMQGRCTLYGGESRSTTGLSNVYKSGPYTDFAQDCPGNGSDMIGPFGHTNYTPVLSSGVTTACPPGSVATGFAFTTRNVNVDSFTLRCSIFMTTTHVTLFGDVSLSAYIDTSTTVDLDPIGNPDGDVTIRDCQEGYFLTGVTGALKSNVLVPADSNGGPYKLDAVQDIHARCTDFDGNASETGSGEDFTSDCPLLSGQQSAVTGVTGVVADLDKENPFFYHLTEFHLECQA